MSPLLKNKEATENKLVKKYCIQSGIMALCIMLFTYLCHSNTLLFGDNTVLRMDLYHQYGPLYSELFDRITSGASLTYSWTSGLGGGFLGNLFNYCCSPFALVMLIFGHKNMPEAIAIMILLKAVFASVSFTYFINKTNDHAERISSAFGVLYAFCGYFVAYSWNLMWLDAMAVFPLVMLGIEKIINEHKPVLFLASLTYTMITNYYMAYMVCILSVIYFLYYYFCRYELTATVNSIAVKSEISAASQELNEENAETPVLKKKKQSTYRILKNNRFFSSGFLFACFGVLSFLLAAFALLPVIFTLRSSSATSSTFPETLKIYFNFFDFAANHLPAVNTTIRSSGDIVLPNVYCGILSIIMLPFYFMSSKVSGKQKIAAAVVIAVFYLSFSINYLNYIWHGFHFPNDLPYRFSFAYSFFILTLVYKAVLSYEEFTKKDYVVAGISLFAFVFFVDKLGSANVEAKTIYLSLIFALFYIVILGLAKSPRYTKKTFSTLVVFLIIVEICFCNTGNYIMSQSKKSYTGDYQSYQEISELVGAQDDTPFYRTELSKLRTRMDPCWYGYNGVSTFSSMAYEKTANLMKALGFFGNKINSYTYYPQTPVFNSLFSLRYIYDNNDLLSENKYYKLAAANETFDAYQYNYYLPLAFSVSSDVAEWDISSQNPFRVQNYLMENATGVVDIMEPVEATDVEVTNLSYLSLDSVNNGTSFMVDKTDKSSEGTVKVIIDVAEAGDYYVYAGSTKLSRLKINAEDFSYDYLSSSIQPILMGVGYQSEGAQIVIEYTVDKANSSASVTFCAAKTNEEKFQAAYNAILSNGVLNITEFNEDNFNGTIKVTNNNGFMFTSIPYDESWHITVDGSELKYYDSELYSTTDGKIVAVGGGLIGFDIEPGEHEIAFRYEPRGLKEGFVLTVFGVLVVIVLAVCFSFKKRKTKKENTAAESFDPAVAETIAPVVSSAAENENVQERAVTADNISIEGTNSTDGNTDGTIE